MTVLGGAPVMAADINEALNRRIGKTEATSDGTGVTSTETVFETLTVDVKAGRTYELAAYFPVSSSGTTDDFFVLLRQGTTAAAAQLTYDRVSFRQSNGVYTAMPRVEFTSASDTSITFGVFVRRVSGSTDTCTPKGATSQRRYLTVELKTTA